MLLLALVHAIPRPPQYMYHAGNVKVRPRRIVLDEALQELRGSDRPGPAPANILHVGNGAVQQLVVFGSQRHPPQLVTGHLAGMQQVICYRVVI